MNRIKMDIDEFIYEVSEELLCYEDIGEAGAKKWAEDFRKWLVDGRKKKNVSVTGDKTYFLIDDEDEIFSIADEYLDAVENGSTAGYWRDFQ